MPTTRMRYTSVPPREVEPPPTGIADRLFAPLTIITKLWRAAVITWAMLVTCFCMSLGSGVYRVSPAVGEFVALYVGVSSALMGANLVARLAFHGHVPRLWTVLILCGISEAALIAVAAGLNAPTLSPMALVHVTFTGVLVCALLHIGILGLALVYTCLSLCIAHHTTLAAMPSWVPAAAPPGHTPLSETALGRFVFIQGVDGSTLQGRALHVFLATAWVCGVILVVALERVWSHMPILCAVHVAWMAFATWTVVLGGILRRTHATACVCPGGCSDDCLDTTSASTNILRHGVVWVYAAGWLWTLWSVSLRGVVDIVGGAALVAWSMLPYTTALFLVSSDVWRIVRALRRV